MDQVTFTRKELYDLIWSTPMTTIAKNYLISDVGMRKICISMDIPLPRAGHWEKIKATKPVEKPLLPQKELGKTEITLKLRTGNDPGPSQPDPVKALAKELINEQTQIFKVSTTLRTSDARIVNAQKNLTEKNRFKDRGLVSAGRGNLSISVSLQNVHRALCFMQTLITILEKRGHQLQIKQDETVVIISGQSLMIALREKIKIKRVPEKWGGFSNEYEPAGPLIFKLGKYSTKEWQDGTKKLEEQLPDILARMEIEAQRSIEAEKERKKQHEEWVEQETRRKLIEQQKKQEFDNFRKLVLDSERWEAAQRLRSYLEVIEQQAIKSDKCTEELKQWLQWAKLKADWLDPLIAVRDEYLSDEDRNKAIVPEKIPLQSFISTSGDDPPYFPRPWYARRK